MKAMLSQPMAGKSEEEIKATREQAIKVLEEKGCISMLIKSGRTSVLV